jgi:hypothetical protein
MKIKPNRTMFLDKRRVEQGKVETVSEAEGKLAVRHGWATEVKSEKDKSGSKDETKTDSSSGSQE